MRSSRRYDAKSEIRPVWTDSTVSERTDLRRVLGS